MTDDPPFSIVRRMMALVAGVTLVSFLLYAVALIMVLRPFTAEISERFSSQIGSLERAMRAVPPAGREAFARAIGSDRVAIGRSPPVDSLVEHEDEVRMPAPLRQHIEAGLGRRLKVITGPAIDGRFKVSFDLVVDNQTWWLTVDGVPPSVASALVPIFASLALIGVAAGLTLLVGVRLITWPMSSLAEDLLARRGALTKIDEPPRASIELQGVIRSFNAMVAAVEAANRSRHDLLAGVSHDLRTPLARLRLRAEIECAPEVADKMEPDFLAMSRIIDQFLAYAQGQGEPTAAPHHPLGQLVEGVVGRYRDEGVDIAFDIDLAGRDAALPQTLVQRAVGNLIDNALAHGQQPIEVELTATGPDEVGLTVYDAGAGIAPEVFSAALKPFVRLQPEATMDGHCGLGLAIVTQVVDRLGGRMVLHPFDGTRSGVGFCLPLTGPSGSAVATASALLPEPAAAARAGDVR